MHATTGILRNPLLGILLYLRPNKGAAQLTEIPWRHQHIEIQHLRCPDMHTCDTWPLRFRGLSMVIVEARNEYGHVDPPSNIKPMHVQSVQVFNLSFGSPRHPSNSKQVLSRTPLSMSWRPEMRSILWTRGIVPRSHRKLIAQ